MASRKYDLVVFGATGFTGSLVVEYYLRTYGPPSPSFQWAIAGRNQDKLRKVIQELETHKGVPESKYLETLIGSSEDSVFLDALTKQTKVVVTTVGPYGKYGSKLVAACAANGTHYADLTGEVPWIAKMIASHEITAQASGARILHCCGFDSEPSDLGAHVLYNAMQKRGLTPTEIKFVLGSSQGGVSGGTVHSLADAMTSPVEEMTNPYILLPDKKKGSVTVKQTRGVWWDQDVRRWNAPFIMAGINTRVVARSSYLMDRVPFTYLETHSFPKGLWGCLQACMLTVAVGVAMVSMTVPPIRWIVLKVIPPGSGPSENARKKGYALIYLVGKGLNKEGKEEVVKGSVRISGDPGYQETAKMLAETGMALAKDKLSVQGGFHTPASALGDTLVARLKRRNLIIEVEE